MGLSETASYMEFKMGIAIGVHRTGYPISGDNHEMFYLGSAISTGFTFTPELMQYAPVLDSLLEVAHGEEPGQITGADLQTLLQEVKYILPMIHNRAILQSFQRLLAFMESKVLDEWSLGIS